MKGEDLTLLEQTTQLTHTRLRTTGYTLESSLKNLPRRLNLQNGSWLYYKTLDIENTAFCLVVTYHPTVASPKEHLYEQMASNPAYDKEKCTKNHRDWLFNSSTCFFVNLHVSSGWCLRTMGKEKTACFSRRSWGRNAWRTPKNVCVGGYVAPRRLWRFARRDFCASTTEISQTDDVKSVRSLARSSDWSHL